MKQVRISDLKSRLSTHLRDAESGEVIEVLDRARPIARLGPVTQDGHGLGLELIPPARSFASVRRLRHQPAELKLTSQEALRLERGTR